MTTEAEHPADGDTVNPFPVDWLEDAEMVPEVRRIHRLKAQAGAREAAVIARAHRRESLRRRASPPPLPG